MKLSQKIAITALMLLTGCNQPIAKRTPSEDQPDALTVTHLSLHSNLNGKPDTEVKIFDYRQNPLHFRAVLNKSLKDSKSRWIFTAKSTSAGNGREIQAVEGNVTGNEMRAQIALKSPWPVGIYHVEMVIDDNPIFGFDYEVTGEQSKIIFLGHSLAPDNGKGLPSVAVHSFKPSHRTIHLQVTTKGVDTTQPDIIWRIFKDIKGKKTELASVSQQKTRLQDSILKAQFQSPKDWERGEYRVEISMNAKVVHSFSFKVE